MAVPSLSDITRGATSAFAAGGGGVTWVVATTGQALASGTPVLANIATAQDFTMPATIASADSFTLSNAASSAATARLVMGAGRVVHGPGATTAAGDNVTIAPGTTLSLVARGANDLEVV